MKRAMTVLYVGAMAICLSVFVGGASADDPVETEGAVGRNEPIRNLDDFRIDERRELQAVASRTLTWLTGSSEQNDYISVGRLAHYFGFIKFRVASGNSVTRSGVAQQTYAVLTDAQRDRLIALVDQQRVPFDRAVAARIEINRALDRLRSGELIERDAFLELGENYGQAEAELGRVLAVGLGEVANSFSAQQREVLQAVRGRHISGRAGKFTMPREVKAGVRHLDREHTQELWNVTSRLLTWTTGTPSDSDFETVGKPSQHFGFVSMRVESGHAVKRGAIAKEVLASLTREQRFELEQVVRGESSPFNRFVSTRSTLCRELERALAGQQIRDESVAAIGREMGRIEAELTWAQAKGILAVRDLLTNAQAEALLAMRARYVPETPPTMTTEMVDLEPESLLATQVMRGRQMFARCILCHAPADEARTIAPSLDGIVGRKIAADQFFQMYSPALRQHAAQHGMWTEDLLIAYLRSPREAVPGTIMGFEGIANDNDRQALIRYLKTLSDESSTQRD